MGPKYIWKHTLLKSLEGRCKNALKEKVNRTESQETAQHNCETDEGELEGQKATLDTTLKTTWITGAELSGYVNTKVNRCSERDWSNGSVYVCLMRWLATGDQERSGWSSWVDWWRKDWLPLLEVTNTHTYNQGKTDRIHRGDEGKHVFTLVCSSQF